MVKGQKPIEDCALATTPIIEDHPHGCLVGRMGCSLPSGENPRDSVIYIQGHVISSFPSEMSTCFVQTFQLDSARSKNIQCGNYCAMIASCRLFCIKGDECSLFKTWVTAEYNGTDQDFYGFTSCYTSWFFSKNLAPLVVPTMATPNSASLAEYQAIKGFFCYEFYSCSVTKFMSNPWWKGDLQMTYTVSTLIVKPRDDSRDFSNVEIRFGNSPKISENPVFSIYPGTKPPAGSVITFKPPTPMEGRYLSFQRFSSCALSVCEVQIIEA
ncbi:uncharacterized protein [Palaemon carinicauda]|uniref:uncharacterized protein n=1 Tax=Palaemon carinicauda TaxID=392227 RepID=UPI0035B60207